MNCSPDVKKISVIIPTFNRIKYLTETIDNIFQQDYPIYELIIVDDFSNDATKKIINDLIIKRGDHTIRYFENEKSKGVSGARNTGLKYAKGEFIAFQDSDDFWVPDKLQRQIAIFQTYPEIDAVVTESAFFGNCEENYGNSSYKKQLFGDKYWIHAGNHVYLSKKETFLFLLDKGCPFRVQSLIFRKRCLKKVDFFDEKMVYLEDSAFLLKFFITGKVVNIGIKLTKIRRHEGNTDNIIDSAGKHEGDVQLIHNIYRYYKKNIVEKNVLIMEKLDKILSNSYIRYSTEAFRSGKYAEAKRNLKFALEIKLSIKSLIRYFLLSVIPGSILNAIRKKLK
ncbi:glycosyltransferase family 2 protein [uncultured Desulfobacter sp.]|uniref:glycosyltransferase family 2 protein n=1 Tax=uncultured Desulfobacter sp. TaxID=240139 RepID=UPI0029F527AA|nr:glycosyltransferase family 2 protein [uncultured Desulfobacter sp.]